MNQSRAFIAGLCKINNDSKPSKKLFRNKKCNICTYV